MKIFGETFRAGLISFLATPSENGWLRSLEREKNKLALSIEQEKSKETSTLFSCKIAPLIRSLSKGSLCQSSLPLLVEKEQKINQLLQKARERVHSAIVSRCLWSCVGLGFQGALVFASMSQVAPVDSRPSITRPEGWDGYTSLQKSNYIHEFMKKNQLTSWPSVEGSLGKKHMHEQFIKPLVQSDKAVYQECRSLVKQLHPDQINGSDRPAYTEVSKFVQSYCPSSQVAEKKFFESVK